MAPDTRETPKQLLRALRSATLLAAACAFSSAAARAEGTAAAPAPRATADASGEAALVPAPAASADPFGLRTSLLAADGDADADMQYVGEDGPGPPPPPPGWRPRRRAVRYADRDARTGAIFGFGLGGAQQYLSGAGHSGGFDTDLRLGYGFSDRLQILFDLGGSTPPDDRYQSLSMWHLRAHAQTVLIGDRRGNGLNLNVGVGFGGVSTTGYSNVHDSSQVGVSVGGGLSFEARVTPHFALAPEVFASWQQVPNDYNLPSDIAWSIGGRLNFIWYSPF